MKTNYEEIMEQYLSMSELTNKDIYHKWYNLKQIAMLTNISYKSCKNMVKEIYEKNKEDGTIYKKGVRYYISHRILDQFKLKQRRKNSVDTIYTYPWVSNICWTTKDFYPVEYHNQIISELQSKNSDFDYIGCVEVDSNGRNHVHLLSNGDPMLLKPILSTLLDDYLDDDRYYRLYCEKVENKAASVEYLIKNPQIIVNSTDLNFDKNA
jgi:hypothetical protein